MTKKMTIGGMYKEWMAWSPALGWENVYILGKDYFNIQKDTKGTMVANLIYGPVLSEMMKDD